MTVRCVGGRLGQVERVRRNGAFVSLLAPSVPRFGSLLAFLSRPEGFSSNPLI